MQTHDFLSNSNKVEEAPDTDTAADTTRQIRIRIPLQIERYTSLSRLADKASWIMPPNYECALECVCELRLT